MAFMSIAIASLLTLFLFGVTVVGLLLFVLGIIFLIIHLKGRKTKKGKGFLIAAIVILCVSIPMSSVFPVLSIIMSSDSYSTDTITINDTVYRNGFSGDLCSLNIYYDQDYHTVDGLRFHRVESEQFDMYYAPLSDTLYTPSHNTFNTLFCSEEQWEQAKSYYADSENFIYYCGNDVIPDMDATKYEALMAFADENKYIPMVSDSDIEACRMPKPDKLSELVFYKVSKDELFISRKDYYFLMINEKLYLLHYYDTVHDEYEEHQELVAVEVPEELGRYFIELLQSQE